MRKKKEGLVNGVMRKSGHRRSGPHGWSTAGSPGGFGAVCRRALPLGLACCLAVSGTFGCTRRRPEEELPTETEEVTETEKETTAPQVEKPTEPTSETIEPFPDAGTSAAMETVPGLKILIGADIHYLARELTDQGPEFVQMVEHGDGKVTNYIWEITEAFTQEVIQERPDLLILPGDLSLNGEWKSHEELAGYLKRIEEAGIPVVVIPGNHDINNIGASRFSEGRRIPAEKTSPQQFYEIYRDFGYDEAISRDTESLSYVYPVSESVWALMLDSCQYDPVNLVGGMIDTETYDWIEEQLDAAYEAGVMLLPVSHHNLLEESRIYEEDCTIEHSDPLIEMLVGWGATLYLSGHLHVQHYMNSDPEWGGETGIYEVVTSSLATPPCQYGVLYFQDDGDFRYHTQILDMDSWARANGSEDENLLKFSEYRVPFLENVFYNQAYDQLQKMTEVGFTQKQKEQMSKVYAKANCYYYWGRAIEIAEQLKESEQYELWSEFAGASVQSEYLDYILEETLADFNYLKWD
ncbi:MAG: metallophosphoesterase [Lachnospiraceae bacterium]|nr:metallophosphoesterase [Lachnospiraceae bacterium]